MLPWAGIPALAACWTQIFQSSGIQNMPGIDFKKELLTPSTSSDGTDCVVCGDKSSGKHYGQFSCEGCKSFFKRSIRRSLSYTCRAAKNCTIDVQHRNQCQYCRLKKCIRMGMRKEAVQRGRLPIPNFNPFVRPPSSSFPPQLSVPVLFQPSKRDSIFEFAAQTIFATVNWAKHSMTSLVRVDQARLLRSSWAPIFLFALAHSNFCGVGLEEYLAEEGAEEVEELQKKTREISEMSLDVVEISSMRAILLFTSDDTEIEEKTKINEISTKLMTALEEYCRINKVDKRFSQLQDCLKLLRAADPNRISRIFFAKLVGTTKIESIVTDLLNLPSFFPPVHPVKVEQF